MKELTVTERAKKALSIQHTESELSSLSSKYSDIKAIESRDDYSLVKLLIEPKPFSVKPFRFTRIFGLNSIYFKHDNYTLEIINTNPSIKSKIYKTGRGCAY